MDRPRVIRGLRIAVSAVCLIICGLLVALWAWSYSRIERYYVQIAPPKNIMLFSSNGGLALGFGDFYTDRWGGVQSNKFLDEDPWNTAKHWYFGFAVRPQAKTNPHIAFPHWFAIVLTAFVGALPWIRWRFSLRTLLIATTLIAVLLGLVMWSMS